jgi:hypothetical protein
VVWTGCFEKFLEMVHRQPNLVLQITFGGSDILLARVVGFLIITVIAGQNSDALGVPLLPLLMTLATLPSALDGGLGWCARPPLVAAFTLPRMKAAPTTSLLEAC